MPKKSACLFYQCDLDLWSSAINDVRNGEMWSVSIEMRKKMWLWIESAQFEFKCVFNKYIFSLLKFVLETNFFRMKHMRNMQGIHVTPDTIECAPLTNKNNQFLRKVSKLSPSVFCRIRVAQSLVFCVVFCRSLFVLLSL
jgi:hypothetical protein